MTILTCIAAGFCLGMLAGLRVAEAILAGVMQRLEELERRPMADNLGDKE